MKPTHSARTAVPIIELSRVEKVFRSGRVSFPTLSGADLAIGAGEMVAVTDPSGSGRSTITNLIAGIDRPPLTPSRPPAAAWRR
jgi:putative ABC transport system ATP-binding protein